MNTYMRYLLGLGFASGLLVSVGTLAPEWLAGLGMDPAGLCDLLSASERERLRHDDLVARDRYFLDNVEGKHRVTEEVLNRTMTLREAAARFQDLNAACPEYDWDGFRRLFPGKTDEERHCRQVLSAVRMKVEADRAQANLLLDRLEAEMQASFHAD
jgi:hypothetical protein